MRAWIRIVLAAASFIIYTCAVLALHQHRDNTFLSERDSFAAGVSSAVYGAPLGMAYASVLAVFRDFGTPLDTAIKKATQREPPPGTPLKKGGDDGNSVGYILVVTWAMCLFGAHPGSPVLLMLGLMGISCGAFLWRFGDDRAVLVVLFFCALTVMLFTPLVWDPSTAIGIPIGGIRYFALVGILPAFHLAVEGINASEIRSPVDQWRFLLLAMQVVILALAILTRTSSASMLGAIGVIWLFGLWRNRDDRSLIWRQISNGAFTAGVGAGFVLLLLLLLPPNYFSEGRITGVTWHRVFTGLGLHPAWPFGNLQEVYDCNYEPLPRGSKLEPGILDSNGTCVWVSYIHKHHLPFEAYTPALYERALSEAFLYVLRHYPRSVFETYLYYKSDMVMFSVKHSIDLKFNMDVYVSLLKGLLIAALLNLFVFIGVSSTITDPVRSLRLGGLVLIFALSSLPAYYAAWSSEMHTADLRLYVLVAIGTALSAATEWGGQIATVRVFRLRTDSPEADGTLDAERRPAQ
jgi:hypothetical protein